ncbi:MAG: S8 family serine peptidase [Thermoleptolyngbya sp. C42_A2020_037]|nr:S8 family serine peptidase [Thermoleptolyngbya sp. C42_A2020_037]
MSWRTNYGCKSGTSIAAPYVTGVVALMPSANPSLTPAAVGSNSGSNG